METAVERFKKRQELKTSLNIATRDTIIESASVVNCGYSSGNDNVFRTFDFSVDQAEVQQLLSEIKQNYDKQRFEELLNSCKESVVSAIVTPLGIGRIVASWDKNGGNVTTIHNAREGIYSSEQELADYETRGDYNSAQYHSHPAYIQKNRENSEFKREGKLHDEYTGNVFTPNADVDLDHTKAAKEIHDDPGRVLAGLDGADLANADSNLNATAKSQNRSMGAKTIDEYQAWLQQTAPARQQRIQELSEKKNLTDKERSEMSKLKEQEAFDYSLAHEKDLKARKEYEQKVNAAYYTSGKFIGKVASSSAIEGTKMGVQQALGVAFCEFFYGILDEAKDIYRNGFRCDDATFFESLKIRFMRVAHRVQEKWRDVLDAFKQGFISGLFSNLVTIIINMFVKTGKNIVRIIREGIFSLLKAVKMLLMPPAGMTFRQAAHEATKIIAAGLTIAGGILLEEYVDKLIKLAPVLELISDILTTVVIGTVTGLASAFVVYYLDKMDIFDVNAQAEYEHTINLLTESMDSSLENAEKICGAIVF